MKKCIKCNQEKKLNEFYSSKSYKDGKMGTCKICFSLISSANKEYRKKYSKTYNENNKQSKKEYNINWKNNNQHYHKLWYQNNKNKINEYQRIKKSKDVIYKISSNIRTRISQSISGYSKSKTTLQILGVSNFNDFKKYLESLFTEGMTWTNYGYGPNKWVIDHRKPLASAITEQDIYDLNHYTNLQPMWWDENMIKGIKIL